MDPIRGFAFACSQSSEAAKWVWDAGIAFYARYNNFLDCSLHTPCVRIFLSLFLSPIWTKRPALDLVVTSILQRMDEARANWMEENDPREALFHLTEHLSYVLDISFHHNPTSNLCLKIMFGFWVFGSCAAGILFPIYHTTKSMQAFFLPSLDKINQHPFTLLHSIFALVNTVNDCFSSRIMKAFGEMSF